MADDRRIFLQPQHLCHRHVRVLLEDLHDAKLEAQIVLGKYAPALRGGAHHHGQ